MPIRFRCTHCDKLLGIGRRKAGSSVKCPSCGQEVMVPNIESVAIPQDRHDAGGGDAYRIDVLPQPAPAPVAAPVAAAPPKAEKKLLGAQLFENSDFEDLLNPVALGGDEPKPKKRRREEPPPLPLDNRGPSAPPQAARQELPPVGIVISPNRATWLSVGAVFVLAIVFSLGVLVGRFLKP